MEAGVFKSRAAFRRVTAREGEVMAANFCVKFGLAASSLWWNIKVRLSVLLAGEAEGRHF